MTPDAQDWIAAGIALALVAELCWVLGMGVGW